jgi:hypothetical protein
MRVLCGLPDVRLLASQLLQQWLANPALSEEIKRLVTALTAELMAQERFDSQNSAASSSSRGRSGSIGDGSAEHSSGEGCEGSLVASDMVVVDGVVRMRGRLKASQQELFKSIMETLVLRGAAVARLVIRRLLCDEVKTGSTRSETVKLVVSLVKALGHRDDQPVGSHLLGLAAGDVLLQGDSEGASKALVSLVVSIAKSAEAVAAFDSLAFLRAVLPPAGTAAAALFSAAQESSLSAGLLQTYADLVVLLQVRNARERMALERGSSERTMLSKATTGLALGALGGMGARGGGVRPGKAVLAPPPFMQSGIRAAAAGLGAGHPGAGGSRAGSTQQTLTGPEAERRITALLQRNLALVEVSCAWMASAVRAAGRLRGWGCSVASPASASQFSVLDWMSRVLCLSAGALTKASQEVDKACVAFLFPHDFLSFSFSLSLSKISIFSHSLANQLTHRHSSFRAWHLTCATKAASRPHFSRRW